MTIFAIATNSLHNNVFDSKAPQQRYDELVSRHPDLFTLFSLKDIASYLNITPTHLSRLRKGEKNNSKQC